jgi:succinate dehydrogenase / fumarate reductase cytochrome b subunit
MRPLSPHLQIYRPQLTSGLSILHRITGVALVFGLPVFVLWLVALARGPQAYASFLTCAHTLVGRALLVGWSWAFIFHLCTGARHLLWDMGLFLDIRQVYKTGYIAVAVSVVLTLGIWFKLLWIAP